MTNDLDTVALRRDERKEEREGAGRRARGTEGPATNAAGAALYVVGAALYLAGAVIAFCGIPLLGRLPEAPSSGMFGVAGAILLAWSPRAGALRSLGLIGVWMTGMFLWKNPFLFLLGSLMLIAGIVLVHAGKSRRLVPVPVSEGP